MKMHVRTRFQTQHLLMMLALQEKYRLHITKMCSKRLLYAPLALLLLDSFRFMLSSLTSSDRVGTPTGSILELFLEFAHPIFMLSFFMFSSAQDSELRDGGDDLFVYRHL